MGGWFLSPAAPHKRQAVNFPCDCLSIADVNHYSYTSLRLSED